MYRLQWSWDLKISLLERCPHFRGCYVHASMELGPEDVSLLERCPHFRGCYVQASMELGPEDVSLLEKCPHFRLLRHMTFTLLEPPLPSSSSLLNLLSSLPGLITIISSSLGGRKNEGGATVGVGWGDGGGCEERE